MAIHHDPVTGGVSADGTNPLYLDKGYRGVGKSSETLADASVGLTSANKDVLYMTPTADRIITLASSGVVKDRDIKVVNLASGVTKVKITVKSSNGDVVATVYNGGTCHIAALQDAPTTEAHWSGLSVITSHWMTEASPTIRNLGAGGTSSAEFSWRRSGSFLEMKGSFIKDGTNGSGAAAVGMVLPDSLEADNTMHGGSSNVAGSAAFFNGATWAALAYSQIDTGDYLAAIFINGGGAYSGADFGGGTRAALSISVAIDGWKSCKG